ncbi:MAG: hypothetical protein HYR96_10235 [Deltaproteobacteria bacterium]|nr:hypothetical protein [Deltaproteobacteria bacterium]
MNRIAILVALTLPFLSTAGEPKATPEFNKATSPEVLHKSYQAMHRVTRKHEIGRSSLTITADCHDTSAAAAEALTQKEAAIRAEIENTLSHLVLAKGERTNYDLSAKAEPQANSPVALQFDLAQKKNRWINRCTGVGSDAPVRVKNVYTVSKTFTVWLANEKQLLNDLTQLVNRIEALSEQGSAGTKVTCAKSGDGNYQLGVTAATEKAAWAEVESEAKRLALEKKDHDFNKTEYNESWEGDGVFSKGPRYDLPSVSVTNVNGQWIGKFANDYSYTVHYKQSTETSHEKEPGQLTDKKSYMG